MDRQLVECGMIASSMQFRIFNIKHVLFNERGKFERTSGDYISKNVLKCTKTGKWYYSVCHFGFLNGIMSLEILRNGIPMTWVSYITELKVFAKLRKISDSVYRLGFYHIIIYFIDISNVLRFDTAEVFLLNISIILFFSEVCGIHC